MDGLEAQLRELLQAHKNCFKVADNGKIECTLNGHTLPPRLDAVSSFIQGAKFQKLARRQAADQALQKYEPFIVQSKNFPLMLYCALTGQLIDKSVDAVKKHMKGKKFLRAKDRFAADELELKPEPSLESFGIKTSTPAEEQQQQQTNGTAGSDEEPGFWVPVGAGSDEEEGGSDADEAEAGSSSGEGDDDVEAGPLGSDDDPMDKDMQPPQEEAAVVAAAKKSSSKAGAKAKQKLGGSSKAAANGAQNRAAAVAGKKRNAHKPSAAKKAKH